MEGYALRIGMKRGFVLWFIGEVNKYIDIYIDKYSITYLLFLVSTVANILSLRVVSKYKISFILFPSPS